MKNKLPDLLLSYTYFLDNYNKSLISVGYDTNLLLPIILLIKQPNNFVIIEFSKFKIINNFRKEINKYFIGDTSSPIIQSSDFSLLRGKQRGLTIADGDCKITLKEKEWNRLYKFIPFINEVINYQYKTAYLVSDFYESYLKQCTEQSVLKLNQLPVTPYEVDTNTINYSRLFYEIPVLCENKLFDDYFKKIIQEAINKSTI